MNNHGTKKRLALLLNAFWINRAGMSGGDRRLLEIFKRIGSHFDLTIYTSEDGKQTAQPYLHNARFVVNTVTGGLHSSYIKRALWASRTVTQEHYDIVYASSDFFPDVLPCHAAKKHNPDTKWVQCVFHIYPLWITRPGNKMSNLAGSLAQRFSLSLIRRSADSIVTLNSQVRDTLVKRGFRNNIMVNPCGVDSTYCFPAKGTSRNHQGCFLARLAPSKGLFDLVDIWSTVVAKLPDARLKIIGAGTDEFVHRVQNRIAEKGMSKSIDMLGYLPEKEAFDLVRTSQVLLFPSHEEGFGIAIAEALACGVPVVAWDLPVYREIYPAGLVTAQLGNISDFALQVLKILDDPHHAAELVKAGVESVKRYDWEQISQDELRYLLG
jgi:glycosyltransferase involved in cell wall biosynthesis